MTTPSLPPSTCPNGHEYPRGGHFCAECGAAIVADGHRIRREMAPPAGQYADRTGQPGRRYLDGEIRDAGKIERAGHQNVWFVLIGLSVLASFLLLYDHFTFDSKYCDYLPDQTCTKWAYLFNWVSSIALLAVLVVVITAVTFAIRWRESLALTVIFVVTSLVVPFMLLVPGTPLHPRMNLQESPSAPVTETSTTVVPAPPGPP
jgi:hypothetical protein